MTVGYMQWNPLGWMQKSSRGASEEVWKQHYPVGSIGKTPVRSLVTKFPEAEGKCCITAPIFNIQDFTADGDELT